MTISLKRRPASATNEEIMAERSRRELALQIDGVQHAADRLTHGENGARLLYGDTWEDAARFLRDVAREMGRDLGWEDKPHAAPAE